MVSAESTLYLLSSGSTTAIATSSATSPSATVSAIAVVNPQGASSKSVATITGADGKTVTVSDEAYQADGAAASAGAAVGSPPDAVIVWAIAGVPTHLGNYPPGRLDDLLGTVMDTLQVGHSRPDANVVSNRSHATVQAALYIGDFDTSDNHNNPWREQSYSWNWAGVSAPNDLTRKAIDIDTDSRFDQVFMGSLITGVNIPFLTEAIAFPEGSTLPSHHGSDIISFA